MLEQDADDLNLLASFLARRGVRSPEEARADVVAVLGNSVVESILVASSPALYRVENGKEAVWLVTSGGIGHSTDDLRTSARSVFPDIETEGKSEAEIMRDVAIRSGVPARQVLIEDRSRNTGENVAFTRRTMEDHGIRPECILIVQDPTMQLRAHATFRRVWGDRPEVRLVSFAPFVPYVVRVDGELRLDNPGVAGLWPFERFVGLVLGEIPRLREYGPSGKGYIAYVEVPPQVEAAYERLAPRFARRA